MSAHREERPMKLVEMRLPEVEAALARTDLGILPTGSVEQHGPHLPFGTDTFAAEVIAGRLARLLDGLLLPFTPLGITPIHMGFKGTITLRPETYVSLLTDVLDSAVRHGLRRFVVVNWHEGNIPSLQTAAAGLVQRTGARVVLVQACYVAEELFGGEVGGLTHGGEIEALPVLLYDPDLVRLDEARGSSEHEQGRRMDRRRRSKGISVVIRDVREIAPTGWYGNPGGATREKAERLFDRLAHRIAEEVRSLI